MQVAQSRLAVNQSSDDFGGSNPTLPTMNITTKEELAWLAGLFEGEGSICHFNRSDRPSKRLEVDLAMTDEDVVQRAANLLDAKVFSKQVREGDKRMYYLRLSDNTARKFLREILPYMGERRTMKILSVL